MNPDLMRKYKEEMLLRREYPTIEDDIRNYCDERMKESFDELLRVIRGDSVIHRRLT